ncbi:MAG: SpoIIIAH-like family protein [Clostridia bacterium]
MKGLLKKNQIIIYVIAIMLMTAGYLNYTTKQGGDSVETSIEMDSKDDTKLADIGDATLVSSNDIVGGDTTDTNTVNTTQNENTNNTNSTNISNTANNTNTNNSTQNTIATSSNASKDDYFTKSKLERDTMYSQMLETYEKVLNSSNSLETQKQTATQEITKINKTKNSIMICENLIKTKGFENVIIFVNGESISVIVGIGELKQEEVAQIQNIVARELNCKVENIHISTK